MLDVRDFTYGLAVGAGAMFLFDPQRGAARRARARGAARRLVHDAQHAIEVGAHDLENRSRGLGARARGALSSSTEPLAEEVLVARVRSRLGRVTSHAHSIEVRLKEGNEVELKGPALASEHDRIVRAASRVPGVEAIDDDLVVYESADGVPGLEGEDLAPRGGRSPATNLVIGAAAAIALLTPLAPTLVKTALLAVLQSLVREAAPQVRRVVQQIGMQHEGDGGAQQQRRRGSELHAQPT